MKLPVWAKVSYWMMLVILVGSVLLRRLDLIVAGDSTPFDSVIFVIWIALLLAPIFSEVKIWGVELKQEVKEVKKELSREIESVRAMVTNQVVVTSNFGTLAPPAESEMPRIKEEVERAIPQKLNDKSYRENEHNRAIPLDAIFLFSVRYQLEEQVRRIGIHTVDEPHHMPFLRLISLLKRHGAISESLALAIIDVYRICSPAIHGDTVSQSQVAFVRDVAPRLIVKLSEIQSISSAAPLGD
ncbi:hypothetical protein [Terriglobus roseus]|uniref:Uncharacterized protein n=1 Tax=Terriglobus roseus TaxID=392734 RepID=A0A1H4LJ38_9BACT|nr:hypothetical protein [Terriglobus roseus]SEB70693.1 hypothetical protein SAMN05443244_1616 [Terriglobus roseus]